jgi:hypothetical protein
VFSNKISKIININYFIVQEVLDKYSTNTNSTKKEVLRRIFQTFLLLYYAVRGFRTKRKYKYIGKICFDIVNDTFFEKGILPLIKHLKLSDNDFCLTVRKHSHDRNLSKYIRLKYFYFDSSFRMESMYKEVDSILAKKIVKIFLIYVMNREKIKFKCFFNFINDYIWNYIIVKRLNIKNFISYNDLKSSPFFYALLKNNKVNYIAFQHGIMTSENKELFNKSYFQHYIVFSELASKMYHTFDMKVDNFLPYGSLMTYFQLKDDVEIKYDICFIEEGGQDVVNGKNLFDIKDYMKFIQNVCTYAEKYPSRKIIFCYREKLRTSLAKNRGLTSLPNRELNKMVEIVDSLIAQYSNIDTTYESYKAINCSNIILSYASTLAMEAMATGKRVIINEYSGQSGMTPREDNFWNNINDNYKSLESKVNFLLDNNSKKIDDQYRKISENYITINKNYFQDLKDLIIL